MLYGISQACCSSIEEMAFCCKLPHNPGRQGSGPWDTRTDAMSSSHIGQWGECDRKDWGGLSLAMPSPLPVQSHQSLGVEQGEHAWGWELFSHRRHCYSLKKYLWGVVIVLIVELVIQTITVEYHELIPRSNSVTPIQLSLIYLFFGLVWLCRSHLKEPFYILRKMIITFRAKISIRRANDSSKNEKRSRVEQIKKLSL